MYEAKQQGRDRVAALGVPHARTPLLLEREPCPGTTARARRTEPGRPGPVGRIRLTRSTGGPRRSLLPCAHDAGRSGPHADGAPAAAGAGGRPGPLAHPAPARRPAGSDGPRRHRPVAGRRAREQRGPGAGHACCPPPGCPRGAARSWLLHRSDDGVTAAAVSPLSGRPVPAGLVTRRGRPASPRTGRSGPPSAASSSRPTRARIGIDVSAVLRAGRRAVAHRPPAAHRGAGALRRPARAGRGPRRRLAGDPAARRRSPPCTRSTGCVHEVIAEAFSPAVDHRRGRRRPSTSPGGSGSASTTSGVEPWFQPSVTLQRAGMLLVEASGRRAATRRALRRRHRAGRPGALRRRAGQPRPEDRHPAQRLRAAAGRNRPLRKDCGRRCAPATACRT